MTAPTGKPKGRPPLPDGERPILTSVRLEPHLISYLKGIGGTLREGITQLVLRDKRRK